MSSHAARPAGPRVSAAWALRGVILCLAGLAITWVVAELVPTARTRDAAALSAFTQLSGYQGLANHVAHLVDPLPYAAFGCALIVLALALGRRRVAVAVLIVLVGAAFSAEQLKPLLAHAHAAAGGHRIEADSWPSGHATAAMALAMCAVLAAPRRLRPV